MASTATSNTFAITFMVLGMLALSFVCLAQASSDVHHEALDAEHESGSGEEDERDSDDIFSDNGDSEDESVRDVVDMFLSIVEQYDRNKENCTPGVTFHLGDGVITQYGRIRFREQAELAVNRANFLTRIWKSASENLLTTSEYFFYTQVRSMVEGDDDVFAAGNCYDYMEFNNYTLFCPFAYRLPNNTIMVKDLSLGYLYLNNGSEFFFMPRQNAERKLAGKYNETRGLNHILSSEREKGESSTGLEDS